MFSLNDEFNDGSISRLSFINIIQRLPLGLLQEEVDYIMDNLV